MNKRQVVLCGMVVQLLLVTPTTVFAYFTLRLIVCIYRNSAVFVSEE